MMSPETFKGVAEKQYQEEKTELHLANAAVECQHRGDYPVRTRLLRGKCAYHGEQQHQGACPPEKHRPQTLDPFIPAKKKAPDLVNNRYRQEHAQRVSRPVHLEVAVVVTVIHDEQDHRFEY